MGITFRSGDYLRFVRIGGRTIKDGEAAAIWNRNGVHTQVIGPKRVWLFYSTVRFLTRFKAEANQYLQIKHRDGRVEHVRGPTSMYLNPSWHDDITVKDGIHLANENQVVVVTSIRTNNGNDTLRSASEGSDPGLTKKGMDGSPPPWRVVKGPNLFIPSETDVVHEFKWNLPPESLSENGGYKERGSYQTLHINTSLLWKTQIPISTVDFAKFKATVAITYKVVSVQRCLQVENPIEEIGASLMVDAQTFGRTLSCEVLKNDPSEIAASLCRLETYPRLLKTAETCGFEMYSVKILAFDLPEHIQRQIDSDRRDAAAAVTEANKKESKIKLQELELEEERKKLENRAELSRKKAQIDAELAEEKFAQKMAAIDRDVELSRKEQAVKLEETKLSDESVLHFLRELKDMGVDMSEFMCTIGGRKVGKEILQRSPSLWPKTDF